ncbi:dihydrolipoyl dehydrogenase family protein [Micromonospora parathelypteridis]|uniref:Pyruvate/2-oxoglutarate dehydrogenase complex dihydrolipoamide dehydrogenase (E3) component n=1 Tax=Micromonospora parathelypteridis TaxID=1839617 RepID=A0A840VNR0_9ACTN|nr:FAD-dependent oxidoreductase [Micromonospora parathelypteridis]MBB5475684.1 pyruvate/2-oxoglutarate dehydrogenase complex dihydrolipoamide dehydrogenase (E3) component [Micromonospora parathelypteridis]GGO27051.1 pyridine nucleotide-disulfide oxidoreductase [Micromonospora parathelypteridis]
MTDRPEEFDLLVVGGGKAGKTLSMDVARSGQRVAMVERGMIGGSCINVACIPTKALVTSARAARHLRGASTLGLAVEGGRVDVDLLRAHKQDVVEGMVAANRQQFLDSGLHLVLGQARFVGPRTVRVSLADGGERLLRGADVVINTGTRPHLPAVPGMAEAGVLTSETLLHLDRLPARLVVLGGGTVGVEFAQMFASFGSTVTLIEGGPRLLTREDPDVSDAVMRVFLDDGIDVRVGVAVARIDRDVAGTVRVTLDDGSLVTGDDVLVAVGREPVTDGLGLDAAGVRLSERGFVVVDEHLRTSAERTWAAGDVAGSPQFTHVALDDYRIIRVNLAGGQRSTADRLIPYTVFTTPELARVGLTETEARRAGHDIQVAHLPVAAIPRARTLRQTEGMWKAVVDAGTDRILGAALLGAEAGEVITSVQLAMLAGMPWTALRDAVITHPTMTEGLNLLFASLRSRPVR